MYIRIAQRGFYSVPAHRQSGTGTILSESHHSHESDTCGTVVVEFFISFYAKTWPSGWQTWQTTTGDNTGTHTTNNFNLYISTNTLFN